MSKMGTYRLGLQEMPEYELGVKARQAGRQRNSRPLLVGRRDAAWVLGWDDEDADQRRNEP